MNRIILGLGLFVSACSPAVAQEPIIQDHYKEVINQKPYHVEVCKNVSVDGDKSGDMLKGAIIGGIIGNNVGDIENGGALGAVLGGMFGHNNSNATGGTKRVCNTEVRYNEERQTIYSHSTIKFVSQGKWYTLNFKR
tara:strand:- start:1291 stop:1701 length:411 start_codon:yes stop_codon:yes gene_type:complete